MTYEFKTKPYDHQKEAIRRARRRAGYAYLMEMGTGKTKAIIDETGILFDEGEIDIMFVFAPKGVYRNWIRELATHMGVEYTVEFWEPGGGNKEKQRKLNAITKPGAGKLRIVLMNIEAVSGTGIAMKYAEQFIRSGICYIVVDESTAIKNPTATRTKNIIKLGRMCAFRRIATGSPAPNSPLDLFSQFEFLGDGLLGCRSYFNFRARHAVMQNKVFGKRKVQVVVGYRNVSELTKHVQENSYRVLKEECLDLPEKLYRIRDVVLTDEQSEAYQAMRRDAYLELRNGGFVSSQSAITTLMRLQQIVCGHVRDSDGGLVHLDNNRVDDMMDELEGIRGAAIIWSRFQPEIYRICEKIKENYGEEALAQFHGVNSKTREEDARRFLSSDKCRFMVSTQQSGGFGNTWLKGTYTIYMSNSFNLEHRLQSEDRPHRGGQTEKCTYTDMCAIGTVDEKLISALKNKINIAETIMGDDPREWLI
jgi:SNF2 family DNA or RNA helicase